jgi:hypothetical protein
MGCIWRPRLFKRAHFWTALYFRVTGCYRLLRSFPRPRLQKGSYLRWLDGPMHGSHRETLERSELEKASILLIFNRLAGGSLT